MRPVQSAFTYAVEACDGLGQLVGCEDAGSGDGLRVRLAGGDFVREQAPVEREAALPLLEGAVEGLAEAAGPHFARGLLRVGHLAVFFQMVVNADGGGVACLKCHQVSE